MSDADERHRRISESAYFKAERRGFGGDRELEDWLEAEGELVRAGSVTAGSAGDAEPTERAPGPESGNAIPTPLGKEEKLRGEETRESADELTAGTRQKTRGATQ